MNDARLVALAAHVKDGSIKREELSTEDILAIQMYWLQLYLFKRKHQCQATKERRVAETHALAEYEPEAPLAV